MAESFFRKESLEQVKSPDNLDRYIYVANPSGWILIACILCLLAGFAVWGFFGTIETAVPAEATVKNGTAVCFAEETQEEIKVGMKVRIGEEENAVSGINADGTVTVNTSLADGTYDAVIVTETVRPISLIFD